MNKKVASIHTNQSTNALEALSLTKIFPVIIETANTFPKQYEETRMVHTQLYSVMTMTAEKKRRHSTAVNVLSLDSIQKLQKQLPDNIKLLSTTKNTFAADILRRPNKRARSETGAAKTEITDEVFSTVCREDPSASRRPGRTGKQCKSDIKEERRMRRVMRNRKAGAKARSRERERLETLSEQIDSLTTQGRTLNKENSQLRVEVQTLMKQLTSAMRGASDYLHEECAELNIVADSKKMVASSPVSSSQYKDQADVTLMEPLDLLQHSTALDICNDDWWQSLTETIMTEEV